MGTLTKTIVPKIFILHFKTLLLSDRNRARLVWISYCKIRHPEVILTLKQRSSTKTWLMVVEFIVRNNDTFFWHSEKFFQIYVLFFASSATKIRIISVDSANMSALQRFWAVFGTKIVSMQFLGTIWVSKCVSTFKRVVWEWFKVL